VEHARGISYEIHEKFKKAVEVQRDQHMEVSEAFEAVEPRANEIVRDAVAKILGEVTANLAGFLGGEKKKICGLLHTNLTSTNRLCEYLYTCKVAYQLHYILTSHPHSARKYAERDIPSI